MDTYVNNFKETSFRPSSIGVEKKRGEGAGRTEDERSGGRPDISLSLLLLLRRPSLDPNLAKKTHLKRGGGGQKSQADREPGRGRRGAGRGT